MRNKKEKFVEKNISEKKLLRGLNFKTIALSVVALLQVAILLIGGTTAWVETVSSIDISGNSKIDTAVKTVAEFGSGSEYDDKDIDLDTYFKKAGDVHLASASSADGKNVYFPIVGDETRYRQATVNDDNVNYINFTFVAKNTSTKDKDFRFNSVPSIRIGDKEITDNRVRMSVTVDGVTKIFSNNADTTSEVVSAIDGSKSLTEINAFSDFVESTDKINDPIFTLEADTTKNVTITLWLQDESVSNEYKGTVFVNNVCLISGNSKKYVSVEYGVSCDKTMGSISVGEEGKNIVYGSEDTTVNLHQSANEKYQFVGWYTDRECTIRAALGDNDSYTIGSESVTFYALFKRTYSLNLFAVSDDEKGDKGGTVQIGDSEQAESVTKSGILDGSSVTITATPKKGYKFVGWYDKISEGNSIPGTETTTVTVTSDTEIFACFEVIRYNIVATAISEDNGNGGTIKYGDENKATVTVTVREGGSATFTANVVEGSGYVFKGWYKTYSNGTFTDIITESSQHTVSNVTDNVTIYACFELKRYTINVYAHSDGEENDLYGMIKCNENTSTKISTVAKYGQSMQFTAVGNDYCDFDGWYDKNNTKLETDVTYYIDSFNDNTVLEIYAKFTVKSKNIKAVVITDSGDTSSVAINNDEPDVTVKYGLNITLSASASNKYDFVGWYKDEACSETIGDNYNDKTISIKVDDSTLGCYYAKFEKKKTYTIYFKNTAGWGKVYAYMWKDGTNNSWPGTEITSNRIGTTAYYSLEVTVDKYVSVIFNQGSSDGQTDTLKIPAIDDEDNCYNYEKNTWEKYDPTTKTKTIYLSNNKGWSNLHCYVYEQSSGSYAEAWPGLTMTDTGKINQYNQSIYKVEFDEKYDCLVFNAGSDKNQTASVGDVQDGNAYYILDTTDSEGHYIVDTWTYNP